MTVISQKDASTELLKTGCFSGTSFIGTLTEMSTLTSVYQHVGGFCFRQLHSIPDVRWANWKCGNNSLTFCLSEMLSVIEHEQLSLCFFWHTESVLSLSVATDHRLFLASLRFCIGQFILEETLLRKLTSLARWQTLLHTFSYVSKEKWFPSLFHYQTFPGCGISERYFNRMLMTAHSIWETTRLLSPEWVHWLRVSLLGWLWLKTHS